MLHVAADAVGSAWLDGPRSAMAGFLVGLLATFLFVRINTRLIRAKVSWWFHDIESEGGTHVHHMVIGVVLMVLVGICLIALTPEDLLAQALALLFGVGVALTLDEFALILNLQDVYWRKEGRISVDAVIIVVCAASLFVLGLNPFGDLGDPGLSAGVFRTALAFWVVVVIVPVLFCLLKGKIWTGVLGLFLPFVAIVGAIRIARPKSPWARRRYAKHPKKLAKAQRREASLDAHTIAWRDAFFDLIAGKPHLPSLPPLGPSGSPADAAAADTPAEPAGEGSANPPPEPADQKAAER
jgi:lysyl-tRNA synthetase class 2